MRSLPRLSADYLRCLSFGGVTTRAENNSRLPGESQATSASTTRESTVAFAPDQLALDGRAPWPRGIPDQETVRSALLRGVKSPGMSASVQEIEEAFGRITNGAGAEVECLRTAMAVRWRLAAAASIAPGGSGFRFRRVNVDEEAATAMQDECEEVVLSLIALVANEKGGSQVGVLRGRFEREFANFREILNRLRQRADAATAVGSTASGTEPVPGRARSSRSPAVAASARWRRFEGDPRSSSSRAFRASRRLALHRSGGWPEPRLFC